MIKHSDKELNAYLMDLMKKLRQAADACETIKEQIVRISKEKK